MCTPGWSLKPWPNIYRRWTPSRFCPDELIEGQRALDHILTYRLLIQQQRDLVLKRVDRIAAKQRGLELADMCAGATFESYQRSDTRYLNILRPYVVIKDSTNTVPAEQPATEENSLPFFITV